MHDSWLLRAFWWAGCVCRHVCTRRCMYVCLLQLRERVHISISSFSLFLTKHVIPYPAKHPLNASSLPTASSTTFSPPTTPLHHTTPPITKPKMSEATPRITAPYLEQFSHQNVRILGKVRQLRGEQATIDAGGQISVYLNRVR